MSDIFEIATGLLAKAIGDGRVLAMATAADGAVNVRMMSMVPLDGKLYATAFDDSLKCQQLRKNSRMALCFDSYQIEGTATVVADLSTPKNQQILARVASAFPIRAKYAAAPGCVIIEFEMTSAKFYDPSATPPLGYSINFANGSAVDLMKKQ